MQPFQCHDTLILNKLVSCRSGLFGQDCLCYFLNFISLLCCLHKRLLMISTMPQHQILSKPTKLSNRKTSVNLCSFGIFPDKGRCGVHLLPPTRVFCPVKRLRCHLPMTKVDPLFHIVFPGISDYADWVISWLSDYVKFSNMSRSSYCCIQQG